MYMCRYCSRQCPIRVYDPPGHTPLSLPVSLSLSLSHTHIHTHSLPLSPSLIAVHEGQQHRDDPTLGQGAGKEVWALQQTHTAVHKGSHLQVGVGGVEEKEEERGG